MKVWVARFQVPTRGKGTYAITSAVEKAVKDSGIQMGQVTILVQHTSASLVIYENADVSARQDLHAYFEKLVPEKDPDWIHTAEGLDDTTSHVRMALTRTSEIIPIMQGRMALGTWQGLYLFEHRKAAHERNVVVSVLGEE